LTSGSRNLHARVRNPVAGYRPGGKAAAKWRDQQRGTAPSKRQPAPTSRIGTYQTVHAQQGQKRPMNIAAEAG